MWIHGGSWVTGDLDGTDPVARSLAVLTGHTVLSVDYRLAPEPTARLSRDRRMRVAPRASP
ncbi:MAG: alpha/beta hydrolase fold domain-containing protein [Ilumatobacteraceae bacterium]|nr:alpha/beta hydrolase fold domain-containing protein [Ilumatobacteraceae bacterium]